jgi:hypothetical protein
MNNFIQKVDGSDNLMRDFGQMSDKDLYKYCKKTGFNARIWNRRFIAALPEVAKRRLYKKYGYCSLHEFASKLAGISHNNVDEVIRIDEKLKDMPKIKSLIAEKGLNKVRLVSNIVTPETENFWAEKIQNMTKSSLRIYINEKFRSGTEGLKNINDPQTQAQISLLDSESFRSQNENVSTVISPKNKKSFTIQIDDKTEFELRKFKPRLEKERREPVDWNSTLKELLIKVSESANSTNMRKRKKINKQNIMAGNQLTLEKSKKADIRATPVISRHIPAKIKYEIEQKYKGHCAYKGCNKPAEQMHHQDGFAIHRSHKNIIPLCKDHHNFIHQNTVQCNNFRSEKFASSA